MEKVYKKLFIVELSIILIVSIITYFLSSKFNLLEYVKPLIANLDIHIINKIVTIILGVSIFIVFITFNRIFLFISIINKYKKLSLVDDLTQLYNRRQIEILLKKSISEVNRYKTPFSIVLLDLDFFKRINDTYGHLKGDYVLRVISHLLKSNSRDSDIVGRWGGEEFIILCSNTNLKEANDFANHVRLEIEKLNINSHIKITASFGIAQYDIEYDKMNKNSLINRVDKALYKAKYYGRNQVVSSYI